MHAIIVPTLEMRKLSTKKVDELAPRSDSLYGSASIQTSVVWFESALFIQVKGRWAVPFRTRNGVGKQGREFIQSNGKPLVVLSKKWS